MESLINLPTGTLLNKFGAGNHKPGSGSAAALQGMLAAQLTLTVITLTNDIKNRGRYKNSLTELNRIDLDIKSRIYPRLEQLFQQDSEEFDRAIKLRQARDEESDRNLKAELNRQSVEALKLPTEILLEIANLCVELSNASIFVFNNGVKFARGDSGVALNNAIAAVSGCLSIINLNLLWFGNEEWPTQINVQSKALKVSYQELTTKGAECFQTLEEDVKINTLYHQEMDSLRSDIWVDKKLSNSDIEEVARQVQLALWKHRNKFFKGSNYQHPIDVLKPDKVLSEILNYKFFWEPTLGQHEVNGELLQIAGVIDKSKRLVSISEQFPISTQNFTAAHELGHALLHKQAILHRDKPLDGSSNRGSKDIKELQADKFATFFLMPRKQVEDQFQQLFVKGVFVINQDTAFGLNEKDVISFRRKCKDLRGLTKILASAESYNGKPFKNLADIFQVSVETMAIRLEELQLVAFS
ncbi:cyclodeaminase/cyclohydrolase family protein [Mucilaginibacter sp. ZT4R22]|uniref:Cyclodeaminase/cyclohydrolase family protein n=1 Tax=Mucilaginibacter pankratovii TaxID=2772110 RepID=A0ABR7WXG5_9SPHI|nr:cyclodeaminase/cyclohydrolase family protein [Mucilaginibacter pankratovii]MBD1366985.1 cyclodeaminase/cyclohydrolase family protein [Mucilaginibacter pankratovii]